MPVISVALAAYRGEKFIGEQLRSLFAQTRLPDEILIGDDSPDDATRRAIAAVLPEKPASVKLEIIVNPQQLGHLKNFENLCAQAGGDFIFFCDQDDVWLPEKIATLNAALENHPDKMLVFCDSIRANATLTKFYDRLLLLFENNAETEVAAFNNGNAFARVFRGRLWLSLHNVAIRREFRAVILPVPDGYSYFDIWLVYISAYCETAYCVHQVLTHYRVHENNASTPSLWGSRRTTFGVLLRRIIEIAWHGSEAEYRQFYEMSTTLRERFAAADASKLNLPDSGRRRNAEMLDAMCEFYRCRMELRKQPRYRRLSEIWRLRNDYPRFVPARWRSVLRDLLI